MNKFLITLVLCLPICISAQTLERSLGIEINPQWSTVRISGGGGVTYRELQRIDSLETGQWGYQLGVVYENRFDKLGFTTGLRFQELAFTTIEQSLHANEPESTFKEEQKAHYVAIPFDVNFYQDIKSRDRVGFFIGVAGNFHLNTVRHRTTYRKNHSPLREEVMEYDKMTFRKMIFSLSTGVAYDRKLSDHWAFKAQAVGEFFLQGNLEAEYNQLNRNYYDLGVQITLKRLLISL